MWQWPCRPVKARPGGPVRDNDPGPAEFEPAGHRRARRLARFGGCMAAGKPLYERRSNLMTAPPTSARHGKAVISPDRTALVTTLVHLWPYIWPADRRDLKARVMAAMVLLLAAKLATIAVPFTFKWATDALVGEGSAPFAPDDWIAWAIAAPILMTIAYAGMRIVMGALTQMRDGLFAKVAMHAVRRLAYRTFEHMHRLSLRFHLERKTGGLTRVLERGRNGIETIVRMVILQLAPTVIELTLIVAVLL